MTGPQLLLLAAEFVLRRFELVHRPREVLVLKPLPVLEQHALLPESVLGLVMLGDEVGAKPFELVLRPSLHALQGLCLFFAVVRQLVALDRQAVPLAQQRLVQLFELDF